MTASEAVAWLRRVASEGTPRRWYACTWDPLEQPHISRFAGAHHPNSDIARGLSKEDAVLAAQAVNYLPLLLSVAEAAGAVLDQSPREYDTPASRELRLAMLTFVTEATYGEFRSG